MRYKNGIVCILLVSLAACAPRTFRQSWIKEKAPAVFWARFETTRGFVDIEARREWSPAGVDRLYQLIHRGYFTNIPIYRVVPGFVAQFGSLDSAATAPWRQNILNDEPVAKSNTVGTLSFARAGKNTRSDQFFINYADNIRLDTSGRAIGVTGFPVLAVVTAGMDSVKAFTPYNDEPRRRLPPNTDAIAFFREKYPKMDFIKKAYLLKKPR